MSLKALHILFISVSVLLAFGFSAWAFRSFALGGEGMHLGLGIGSAVAGVALIIYGRYAWRKLKHISYL
jgi:Na+-driven multidrug efflux pump